MTTPKAFIRPIVVTGRDKKYSYRSNMWICGVIVSLMVVFSLTMAIVVTQLFTVVHDLQTQQVHLFSKYCASLPYGCICHVIISAQGRKLLPVSDGLRGREYEGRVQHSPRMLRSTKQLLRLIFALYLPFRHVTEDTKLILLLQRIMMAGDSKAHSQVRPENAPVLCYKSTLLYA